jgi:sterol 24-C-methyltransferase
MLRLGKSAGKSDGGGKIEKYTEYYSEDTAAKTSERTAAYTEVVNDYYDLVTDFYSYGWGDSFHFAPRARGETFQESLRRHEYFLALKMNMHKGQRIVGS